MRCLLVGSGGMAPLPDRYLNVLLVQLEERGYLFDCGEGTQIAMMRWHAGFRHIGLLAVTHLHGDHVLGIPGFLMARANAGAVDPLTVLGPPGTRRFVENVIADVAFVPPYALEFREYEPEGRRHEHQEVFRDDRCTISAAPLKHNTLCLGYRLAEFERPGRFHPEKARRAGVPAGPLWGKLQQGQPVDLEDGRRVEPEEVLGPQRRGRVCALVTDTLPCTGAYDLLAGADIAFVEGMFLERDREAADERAHMTVANAARIARKQAVERAVLVHLSPRYRNDRLDELEAEARSEYDAAEIGRDGRWYEVALPD